MKRVIKYSDELGRLPVKTKDHFKYVSLNFSGSEKNELRKLLKRVIIEH